MPVIETGVSAHQWVLSEEGRESSARMARQLRKYAPQLVVTSTEPKAVETGAIIAATLELPRKKVSNLQEHDRHGVPVFESREAFQAQVAQFFTHPDELIFGNETATEALERFTAAIHEILAGHPEETVVVVTHGTVMTLFVTAANPQDPIPFWKSLGLPAFVVLSRPDFRLERVENHYPNI